MTKYPLFVPPANLAKKPHRSWTSSEAKQYFEWLKDICGSRVDTLLTFLGIHYDQEAPREMLSLAGKEAESKLRETIFSLNIGDDRYDLTNQGHALAADLGLLLARLLLAEGKGKVRWVVQSRPKSDLSYNLPVLAGLGPIRMDPVGGSISEALAVLDGQRDSGAWLRAFDYWREKIESPS